MHPPLLLLVLALPLLLVLALPLLLVLALPLLLVLALPLLLVLALLPGLPPLLPLLELSPLLLVLLLPPLLVLLVLLLELLPPDPLSLAPGASCPPPPSLDASSPPSGAGTTQPSKGLSAPHAGYATAAAPSTMSLRRPKLDGSPDMFKGSRLPSCACPGRSENHRGRGRLRIAAADD